MEMKLKLNRATLKKESKPGRFTLPDFYTELLFKKKRRRRRRKIYMCF